MLVIRPFTRFPVSSCRRKSFCWRRCPLNLQTLRPSAGWTFRAPFALSVWPKLNILNSIKINSEWKRSFLFWLALRRAKQAEGGRGHHICSFKTLSLSNCIWSVINLCRICSLEPNGQFWYQIRCEGTETVFFSLFELTNHSAKSCIILDTFLLFINFKQYKPCPTVQSKSWKWVTYEPVRLRSRSHWRSAPCSVFQDISSRARVSTPKSDVETPWARGKSIIIL